MRFLDLESSRAAYRADFFFYAAAVAALLLAMGFGAPAADAAWLLTMAMLGWLLWGLLEYLLHRWVLHRLPPFRAMHALHHQRPQARVGTPTVVSAPLFALLVALPAWALLGLWPACALTAGVLAGYLAYALTHHLCHHARPGGTPSPWLQGRRHWHARHHQRGQPAACFGVSHGLWDHLFGSARVPFIPVSGRCKHLG